MLGLYLILAVLVATVAFLGYAMVRPKLKRYQLVLKQVGTKKRHARHAKPKRKKSVWIKVM